MNSAAPALGAQAGAERPWWRSLKGPIAVLLADLHAPSARERRRAAEALVRLGDARAVSALAEALGDAVWEVREACARAIAELGGDGAEAALRRAVADAHPAVRLAALEGLARHGRQAALVYLTGLRAERATWGTPEERAAIEAALARVQARLDAP